MRSNDALADSHMREHYFPNRTGCIKRDGSRRSHNRCCKPRADHAIRSAGGLAAPRPPRRPRRPGRPKRSERKLSGALRQVDHGRALCQATSTTGATISAWFAHREVSSTQPRSNQRPPVCKPPPDGFPAKSGPMWYSPTVLSAQTEYQSSTTRLPKPPDLQAFPPVEPTGIEPVTSCLQIGL